MAEINKVYQTEFHDAEKNKGNCLAAAVATVFNLNLYEIPDFLSFAGDWFDILIDFSQACGYNLVHDYEESGHDLNVPYIAYGMSPRDFKIKHAVVFQNGNMIHDPHPSNEGILTESGYFFFRKI